MKKIAFLIGLMGLNSVVFAAPQDFDFKDPKGVNNVIFKTDAPLESINGTATGVSGNVSFDPANPGGLKGKIIVDSSSLHVPNPMMKEHLHSDKWLDVTKFPQITFEATGVDKIKTTGDVTTADLTGNMTIKGETKKITVPVKITYLKDRLKDRFPKLQGDLLVLRSNFTVKRSDFGINKGSFEDKVADDIELTLSLAGQSPR